MYEMLTGQPPYAGDTAKEIAERILSGPLLPAVKLNPGVPSSLGAVVDGAMARELGDRYATMHDVVADLGRVNEGTPVLGPHSRTQGEPVGTHDEIDAHAVGSGASSRRLRRELRLWPLRLVMAGATFATVLLVSIALLGPVAVELLASILLIPAVGLPAFILVASVLSWWRGGPRVEAERKHLRRLMRRRPRIHASGGPRRPRVSTGSRTRRTGKD